MGVTSNPTIFEKAIAGSADYDAQLRDLAAQGASVEAMYEALVLEDIARAADLLRPIYEHTNGVDGYISLEVSPTLARNTADTVAQAQRLFATLHRPNVMIKVPATREGIPAIRQLISEGINVNVTLIFSLAQYDAVAEAYISGLEMHHKKGGDISRVASVASFFVSRVDSALDKTLAAKDAHQLVGKIAIANAKLAYARFGERFSGARWGKLAQAGARVQRPLWASTGVKNPALPDTLYVDALIGPDTVNTVPPATLQATLLGATPARTIDAGLTEANAQVAQLTALGIDLDAVTQTLQDEGVASFEKSFESLMTSIQQKRERLLDEQAYQAS
jgi:transaldolase